MGQRDSMIEENIKENANLMGKILMRLRRHLFLAAESENGSRHGSPVHSQHGTVNDDDSSVNNPNAIAARPEINN